MIDQRILGFDFGMKRIGVALGQTLLQTARPLTTLKANDGIPNWQEITQLINDWQPACLVVGIPYQIDGTTQHTTFAAKKFSNRLKERFQLAVYPVDERLTTIEARDLLFKEGGFKALSKAEIDSYAAKLIVEQWLTSQNIG